MVGWGWLVDRSWGMVGWGFVDWFVGIVTWSAFVCYFNNVARIAIGSVVFDYLGTAIGKSNTVFTIGRVTITSFISSEVDSRIIVSNSVFVLVFSWYISVSWFFVGWGMVSWSGVVCWSRLVVHWSWFVNWGWVVYWSRLVIGRGSMVAWGMSNSVAVSIGVSVFNCGMAGNIGIGNSQEGNKSDEGLKH